MTGNTVNFMRDVKQQLDEIERIQDELYRHMDRFAGMLKTAHDNPNPVTMNFLREEHREMNRLNALIDVKFNSLKERNNVKRVSMLALLVIVLLVAFSSFAVAQDNLATNTPQMVEGTATLVSSEPIPTPMPVAPEVPGGDEAPTGGNSGLIELAKVVAPWLGAIGIAALIVMMVLGREALVRLGKSQPAYAREPVFSGIETGLAKLEEYTHTTETTIDDAAAAELKRFILGIIGEIREQEQAKSGVVATATDQGAWHIDESAQS